MGIFSKISQWRLQFFLWVGLPVIAVGGILFAGFDVVPAWKAHNGGGIVGTFTAKDQQCGRRSCTWHGSWVAKDGSNQSRTDTILYDDPDGLAVGETVEATDTGARGGVFATAGGSTYLLMTGFSIAGIAALVGWVFVIRNAIRRRRSAANPESSGAVVNTGA